MSAESDMGVSIGARARINQDNGGSGTGINGVRFFAKSGGIEVGVGNIYGALEVMPGQYPIDLGLTGLGYDYVAYNFRGDAYSSGGAGASQQNGVEVMYSMGDLSMHVSASDVNDRVAAHVAYKTNGFTFAAGVQDSNDASDTEFALSVGGNVGVADVVLAYAKNGDDNNIIGTGGNGDHIVLAAKFDVGAATNVEVYVANADYFADTSYGVDFNHDLGGGTSLRGGVASRGNGLVRADLGVRFNF
jgi:outer membrane protein OmpU